MDELVAGGVVVDAALEDEGLVRRGVDEVVEAVGHLGVRGRERARVGQARAVGVAGAQAVRRVVAEGLERGRELARRLHDVGGDVGAGLERLARVDAQVVGKLRHAAQVQRVLGLAQALQDRALLDGLLVHAGEHRHELLLGARELALREHGMVRANHIGAGLVRARVLEAVVHLTHGEVRVGLVEGRQGHVLLGRLHVGLAVLLHDAVRVDALLLLLVEAARHHVGAVAKAAALRVLHVHRVGRLTPRQGVEGGRTGVELSQDGLRERTLLVVVAELAGQQRGDARHVALLEVVRQRGGVLVGVVLRGVRVEGEVGLGDTAQVVEGVRVGDAELLLLRARGEATRREVADRVAEVRAHGVLVALAGEHRVQVAAATGHDPLAHAGLAVEGPRKRRGRHRFRT